MAYTYWPDGTPRAPSRRGKDGAPMALVGFMIRGYVNGDIPTDVCYPWPYAKQSSSTPIVWDKRNWTTISARKLILDEVGAEGSGQVVALCDDPTCVNPHHIAFAQELEEL